MTVVMVLLLAFGGRRGGARVFGRGKCALDYAAGGGGEGGGLEGLGLFLVVAVL